MQFFFFIYVSLLGWIIDQRLWQNIQCGAAMGAASVHDEFTVAFAEANQYGMKKGRQGEASQ